MSAAENKEFIIKKYKAEKFIIYFQNYTNTYLKFEIFKDYILECIGDNIVEISISTRPDCITQDILVFLNEIKSKYNININFELGLQTCNYKTLKKLNRGHTLAEYIHGVNKIKKYNFELCTHMILNLPWDDEEDAVEGAKILSSLEIDTVKIHSLYILKNTLLGNMYEKNQIEIIEKAEYIKRMILFLEYLDPKIGIQRLFSRAPKERTLFCNWDTSWWKLKDQLIELMKEKETYQGKKFQYLKPRIARNI